jgi:hypothetical protein
MEGETLEGLLSRVLSDVRRKLGDPAPMGMPPAGVHLYEIEARILLAAAQSTLDRLRAGRC